jgi:hypothetical protein
MAQAPRQGAEDSGPAGNSRCPIDTGIAQRLKRHSQLHPARLRAIPRTCSSSSEASSSLRARSSGVRRNCSIKSVKSTPNVFAASMRLPGAGFRNLAAALANSSAVNARSSPTTLSLPPRRLLLVNGVKSCAMGAAFSAILSEGNEGHVKQDSSDRFRVIITRSRGFATGAGCASSIGEVGRPSGRDG